MLKIFLTGATGVMGFETLRSLLDCGDLFAVTVLARDSKKNHRLLDKYVKANQIKVVWGDLLDKDSIRKGTAGADLVLHIGGMVSPAADRYPEQTWKVNTGAMRNIVEAVRERRDADRVGVVYIGSVSQYGPRNEPLHWGRTGDPMRAAEGDWYALSKIEAERILAESGLKKWVSLRQTGILYPALLFNGTDPISFHVPLRGTLEWTTVEDSARLMTCLCQRFSRLPDSFWRHFYNIGSGPEFRMMNYDFERRLLKALNCPPPEKVFETQWFATDNFHGFWYLDSDRLEEMLPFRSRMDADQYFRDMARRLPAYFKLARIVPAPLIKAAMKMVAKKKPLGTLSWTSGRDPQRTRRFFGSDQLRDQISAWKDFNLQPPSAEPLLLDHGYDESKPESQLELADMQAAARFRGGRCLSETMEQGDLSTSLEWECGAGHRFKATPTTVLLGGHWCPECFQTHRDYASEAEFNPFLRQLFPKQ